MTLKIRLLAGIPILFALIFAFIWLHFILDTMPAGFYSGDDINFFSPLISEFAATGDLSLLFEPQGPHMHLFYKLQTYLSMNYFGWNPHLTPALGLLLLLGLAWTFSLRKINMTDNFVGKKESFRVYLFWMIANLGFVCVILGHLNQRSFSYHMLSLNNPVLIGLGAVCLYKFAKLLNNPGHWQFVTLGVFSFASLLFIWGLSTAFNYFLLAALAFMAFIIAGPTFVKALINVIFRHQKPYGIVNWLRDYRSAMVGGCLFTFLTLLYYVIVSGAGGNTGLSLSSISPSFILDISYASAGWVFLTGKYAIAAKSIVTLVFALAVSLIIFFTRRISRNDKLFFTGVIVFILFFGLGTVMLRGNNAILLPRYVAVFGLFWIAATWALGRVSIGKITQDKNHDSSYKNWCLLFDKYSHMAAVACLGLIIIFSVFGMKDTIKSSKYVKVYYQTRLITAFYTPIDQITDQEFRQHVFCKLNRESCEMEIARMRCFAQMQNKNICMAGKREEIMNIIYSYSKQPETTVR